MSHKVKIERQAVVIIHGIGEQRPTSTLKSFVQSLIRIDSKPGAKILWSRPDRISEGFEHRRYSLSATRDRPLTDVYEFYWAHLFDQNSFRTFLVWFFRLTLKPNKDLPQRLRSFFNYIRLAMSAVALIIGGLIHVLSSYNDAVSALLSIPIVSIISLILVASISNFFLQTISDAARYLDASPRNVQSRNAVRELGVKFLLRLHTSYRQYDRIIVCGHSLGSVIAYDILKHTWYEYYDTFSSASEINQPVIKEMDRAIKAGEHKKMRELQLKLWAEQVNLGNKWRVTDLITLGSPLSYADVLLADSVSEFREMKSRGELPTCPPILDARDGGISRKLNFTKRLEDESKVRRTIRVLRAPSLFSVTRWSNIYFKTRLGIIGDPIAGPLNTLFGEGIRDFEVEPVGKRRYFTHTSYWSDLGTTLESEVDPLVALRRSLNLDRKELG